MKILPDVTLYTHPPYKYADFPLNSIAVTLFKTFFYVDFQRLFKTYNQRN